MAKTNNENNANNTTNEPFKTVVKGTLTRFRWEKGYKGKGDERRNISVKLNEPLTDELRKKILSVLEKANKVVVSNQKEKTEK